MSDLFESAGLSDGAPRPLADRLRPQKLSDVVGQDHLVGPDGTLSRMLQAKRLSSIIFWGPPGVGKTTIARLLAQDNVRERGRNLALKIQRRNVPKVFCIFLDIFLCIKFGF